MSPDEAVPRSVRARPAKALLSREVIVRAALDIIGRQGLSAVSMRKVAQLLDTAGASLYVYVDDRADLVAAAFDLALAPVRLPDRGQGPWRRQLETLVSDEISALSSHGDLALLALSEAQIGANSLRLAECMLSLLREGGVPDEVCIPAADLLEQYVASTALEEASWRRAEEAAREAETAGPASAADPARSGWERMDRAYAGLSPEMFPTLVSLRGHLANSRAEARHLWKLKVIIDGILADRVAV